MVKYGRSRPLNSFVKYVFIITIVVYHIAWFYVLIPFINKFIICFFYYYYYKFRIFFFFFFCGTPK